MNKIFKLLIIISLFTIFLPFVKNYPAGQGKKFPINIANKEILIKVYQNTDFKIYSFLNHTKKIKLLAQGNCLFKVNLKDPNNVQTFNINSSSIKTLQNNSGSEYLKTISFTALSQDSSLEQSFVFIIPKKLSNSILYKASLSNESNKPIEISEYESFNTSLDAKNFGADSSYKFWSFQGGSYPERYDWIFPLTPAYSRENYQGMNAPDYGGGIPVVDLWTKEQGLAFASIDVSPQLISLPVRVEHSG
ncbi:MAG: hypothetical protein ACYC6C_13835, partial [Coriobacteriia bacterium]